MDWYMVGYVVALGLLIDVEKTFKAESLWPLRVARVIFAVMLIGCLEHYVDGRIAIALSAHGVHQ
jgi:hypothetical protein